MENIVDKLKSYRYSAIERLIGLKSKSILGTNEISLSDASGSNAIAFGTKGNSIQNGEPTPDIPIEIENISENVEVKNANKNFLNVPSEYELYQYKFNVPLLLKAGTYTVSAKSIVTSGTNNSLIEFKYTDGTKIQAKLSSSQLVTTITFTQDVYEYSIYSQNNYANSTGITTTFTNLMLSKDGGEYAPRQENIVTFPLADGQKLYKDTYLADDGIHHKRKQVVINGVDGIWEGVSIRTNTVRFYIRQLLMDMKEESGQTNICCSHFPAKLIYDLDEIGIYINYANYNYRSIYVSTPISIGTTIEEIKAWFVQRYEAGTPVVIEYEPKEEIIVPYTEEQQVAYNKLKNLAMFKGVNNIEVSSNIEVSETSIEYYSDEVVSLDNYKFEVKEI